MTRNGARPFKTADPAHDPRGDARGPAGRGTKPLPRFDPTCLGPDRSWDIASGAPIGLRRTRRTQGGEGK